MDFATQQAIITLVAAFLLLLTSGCMWAKLIKQVLIPAGQFFCLAIAAILMMSKVRECASMEEFKNEKLVNNALQALQVTEWIYTISLLTYVLFSIRLRAKEEGGAQ